jgi:hypothetical protein
MNVAIKPIILRVIMVNVIILNVIMLNVIVLNVIMLRVIMLSVIILSVIMLNVIIMSVVAPTEEMSQHFFPFTQFEFSSAIFWLKIGRLKVWTYIIKLFKTVIN